MEMECNHDWVYIYDKEVCNNGYYRECNSCGHMQLVSKEKYEENKQGSV